MKRLNSAVLLAGHPLLRVNRHLDVAQNQFRAEDRPAPAGVWIVNHLRDVDASLKLMPFAPLARLGEQHGLDVRSKTEILHVGDRDSPLQAQDAVDAGAHGFPAAALQLKIVSVRFLVVGDQAAFDAVPARGYGSAVAQLRVCDPGIAQNDLREGPLDPARRWAWAAGAGARAVPKPLVIPPICLGVFRQIHDGIDRDDLRRR